MFGRSCGSYGIVLRVEFGTKVGSGLIVLEDDSKNIVLVVASTDKAFQLT